MPGPIDRKNGLDCGAQDPDLFSLLSLGHWLYVVLRGSGVLGRLKIRQILMNAR